MKEITESLLQQINQDRSLFKMKHQADSFLSNDQDNQHKVDDELSSSISANHHEIFFTSNIIEDFYNSDSMTPDDFGSQQYEEMQKQNDKTKNQISSRKLLDSQSSEVTHEYQSNQILQSAIFRISIPKKIRGENQFFLFCDIIIEPEVILQKSVEQKKRSNTNDFKKISCCRKIFNSNMNGLIEIELMDTKETLMEFNQVCEHLDSLNDQQARLVSQKLRDLRVKTQMAAESVKQYKDIPILVHHLNNRRQFAREQYQQIKQQISSQHQYYLYNHYEYCISTGNIAIRNKGYSKSLLDVLSISSDVYNALQQKIGIVEFLKRDFKTEFTLSYFDRFIFDMHRFPEELTFQSEFITVDNICLQLQINHTLVNLCKDFDEKTNFVCPFIDFVCIIVPQIDQQLLDSLNSIRESRHLDPIAFQELDDEDIDFAYDQSTHLLLQRYYRDIFSKQYNLPSLLRQVIQFPPPSPPIN